MNEHAQQIRELLDRVRRRWRRLVLLHGTARGALAAAGVLALALVLSHWTSGRPIVLAVIGLIAVVSAFAAFVWGVWPARTTPSDTRVARFIEERDASLDDRLVSAVDVIASPSASDAASLTGPMLADAARSTSAIDSSAIIPSERLRTAGFQAAAALLLFVLVGVSARDTIGQAIDATALIVFPERI